MNRDQIKKALRFYFITDDSAPDFSPLKQTEIAIQAGATLIQYRNKSISAKDIQEAQSIRDLCKCNRVPFVVNDNILMAKAVSADGVHLGQEDESPQTARAILGDTAIIGISVSDSEELERTDLTGCDYIGTGPVFSTHTKPDAKQAIGPQGLEKVVRAVSLPVVAIGGIDAGNARQCFDYGVDGVSVISCISRSENPAESASALGSVCGSKPKASIAISWKDEFGLIDKLLAYAPADNRDRPGIRISPGDDAALLHSIKNPVITTDTQKEGVHFVLDWQTPKEVGMKAVSITLSDLAACYAKPISLFINLSLPKSVSNSIVEELYKGMKVSLEAYGCTIGGGNISSGEQFSIDLFAVGEGREDLFPTRSAAKPGEGLYTTGPLGLSRAGLLCLMSKETGFDRLIEKFKTPRARFDAAEILFKHQVECVMDVSDGLAGDAGHIAEASQITIEFDLDPNTFDPDLVSLCRQYGRTPEEMIMGGGEDYELLFTCRPEIFQKVKSELPGSLKVGRCAPFKNSHLSNLPKGISSFQHGKP
jgi:thiamine-monophosphate kinase